MRSGFESRGIGTTQMLAREKVVSTSGQHHGKSRVLLLPHSLNGLASLNLAKSPIWSVQNALRPMLTEGIEQMSAQLKGSWMRRGPHASLPR